MTTVAWATDLHFDHAEPGDVVAFSDAVRASGATALLVGGDTANAAVVDRRLVELADLTGLPVHFVLGNHDYYGGSIAAVRARIGALAHPGLHWLAVAGPRELAPGVAVVGHGGWGDARIGDFAGSAVVLTDYVAIAELRRVFDLDAFTGTFGEGSPLEAELRRLGREAADTLASQLAAASTSCRHVVVLTHVPPFREACWHEGAISGEHWLPGFSCGAAGEVILAAAAAHPGCRFTVLCGHTHSGGTARLAANLVALTQAADYGRPGFVLLGVDGDDIVQGGRVR
jgi:predicted phosphohydrolase